MKGRGKPVVVIGAGVGGLVAACSLAHRGIETVVVEKNSMIGGYNSPFAKDGYRFDIGATMLHTPDVLIEIFESFGTRMEDHLDLIPLDPMYRIAFPDGRELDVVPSVDRMADGIAAFSSRDAKGFLEYMKDMDQFKRTLKRLLIDRVPGRPPRPSIDLARLLKAFNPLRSVEDVAQRYFDTQHMRTAFTFQVLYWGVPPRRCPAVYGMIPYFEVTMGVWHVRGGLHSISAALGRIFRSKGGTIHLDAPVEKVEVSRGTVRGVRLATGDVIEASAVVSNADALYTYRELVPSDALPLLARKRLGRMRPSSAVQVALLGMKGKAAVRGLPHHTFVTPIEVNEVCHQIFEKHEPPSSTYVYLCIPTITDSTMAPPDRTAVYALTLMPHRLKGQTWEAFREGVVRRVTQEMESRGMIDPGVGLDLEQVFLPPDFEQGFNQPAGMGFGIRSSLGQMGPLRFATRSRHIKGLYVAGASANPGAGLPLVSASGRAAADAVADDLAPWPR